MIILNQWLIMRVTATARGPISLPWYRFSDLVVHQIYRFTTKCSKIDTTLISTCLSAPLPLTLASAVALRGTEIPSHNHDPCQPIRQPHALSLWNAKRSVRGCQLRVSPARSSVWSHPGKAAGSMFESQDIILFAPHTCQTLHYHSSNCARHTLTLL